jgi:predicted lipid-binding transport protein (Tim44 family)
MIHAHLAAAGGGAGGFGGGGGGGGGGRGAGLYILIQILIRIAIFGHGLGVIIIIGLIVLAFLFSRMFPGARAFWSAREDAGRAARRRVAHRQRRVELAAAEAAEEDPAFAPDVVRRAAIWLFKRVQSAWDAGDRAALGRLVTPELRAEWERRLDELERRGWRNRVKPLSEPRVEYVGLSQHGDGDRDRVVVRVEARLRDYVEDRSGNHIKRSGMLSEVVNVREFWTLAKGASGGWILASIEHGAEGSHALDEKIVPTPWSDEQSLRDEALVEGAVKDAVPEGTKIAEVADLEFEGDARAAALDLALADGRFAPDVLEVAARRAVAAWAEAVDGDDARLNAIASRQAVDQLLHPGGADKRLVVRGPSVKQIRVGSLDAAAEPPTMTIEVDVEGRRYVEDRDTTEVVVGSRSRRTTFTEHWTFALDGGAAQPWRIVAVGAPARL